MATRALILRPGYFPLFDKGKPISSGYIYIGEPDLDPEIVSNQKAITFLQENGTEVPGSQPVRTSAGGVPTYNGSPVTVLVDGDYSVKVLDKHGSQVYYVPKNADLQDSDIVTKVATITELRPLTGLVDGQVVYLSDDGNGGAGFYKIESGSDPEDLPSVVVLDNGRRAVIQPAASNVTSAINQAEADANNYTDAAEVAVKDYADAVGAAAVSTAEYYTDSVIAGISGGASVYADTTTGLAATSEGEYFNVPSTEEDELLILYLHDTGGVATEIGSSPSAVGVANAMDVTENASRIVVSSNLFDLGAATDGKRVSTADGTLYNGVSYTTSDYIPVEPGTEYEWSDTSQYAVYDANKAFITGGAASAISTGGTAAFVRYDMLTTNAATSMFAKSSEYPSSYTPYSTGVDFSDFVYDSDAVEEILFDTESVLRDGLSVEKRNLPFMVRVSSNLYDKNAAGSIDGYRLLESDAMVASATNSISDYIPAQGGESYAVTEGSYTHFYNSDKEYIDGHGTGITVFTAPAGTAFIRTTVRLVRQDDLMFVASDQVPTVYQPYDLWTFDETVEAGGSGGGSRWQGLKWNVMGDSITESASAYWRSLAADFGFSVARNYGVGGTAVAVRAAPWDTNAMCIRYDDMDDDADLITVMCGTNDFNQVALGAFGDAVNTTFYGALNVLCAGLVEKYPTKTIAFLTLPPRENMQSAGLGGHTVFDYADAIQEVCEYYAIPVFDTLRATQLRPFNADNKTAFMPDGLHPNADGHDILARNMREFLASL